MKDRKPGRAEDEPAEVDIAPLIDVVFLLIVFFMSIWQAANLEVVKNLELPTVSQGNPETQADADRLIVNVNRGGDYYVSNSRLSAEALRAFLRKDAARSRDAEGFATRPVFIRADADLRFGKVRDVMAMCRDARIWKLSLRTTDLSQTAGAAGGGRP